MPKNNLKKIISWNVNGLRALEKKGFVNIVMELAPDIMAIQETKASVEQLSDNLIHIPGYKSYWHSAEKKGYSGVAVYCRREPERVMYGIGQEKFDREGRVITLEYADFYLINAYFPNAQPGLARIDYKLSFNNRIKTFADELARNKSVVLCGDLNVAHKEIDLRNPKTNEKNPGFSIQERAWMDLFLDSGYLDTFRMFNREPDNYTWWSYRFRARSRNIGWRIDYFCVDANSRKRVKDAAIMDQIMGSDHCPVSLDFQ